MLADAVAIIGTMVSLILFVTPYHWSYALKIFQDLVFGEVDR